MTFVRILVSIATFTAATLAISACAAIDDPHDGHHPSSAAPAQVAQAKPATPASGMGGMGGMGNMGDMSGAGMPAMEAQMKAMREMHRKMSAAKTPEERNALMAEHMKVMQNGMAMMGGMGPSAMPGKPGDLAARQRMMEQCMDMMQTMMDGMPPVPATK